MATRARQHDQPDNPGYPLYGTPEQYKSALEGKMNDLEVKMTKLEGQLNDYQGQREDLVRDSNRLDASHQPDNKIAQMRRDINNDIAQVDKNISNTQKDITDTQKDIGATRDELLKLHLVEEKEKEKELRELDAINEDGEKKLDAAKEHAKADGKDHGQDGDSHGTQDSGHGTSPAKSHDGSGPAPGAHGTNGQHIDTPQPPYGNVGDWYLPGEGPIPKPPDLGDTTPMVSFAQAPQAEAHHETSVPSLEKGVLAAYIVVAAGVDIAKEKLSSLFASKDDNAAPSPEQASAGAQQSQSEAPPTPAAPPMEIEGSHHSKTPEQATPAMPPVPGAQMESTPQQNAPRQAAPAIPPTPDSQPIAAAAPAAPAPAAHDPDL